MIVASIASQSAGPGTRANIVKTNNTAKFVAINRVWRNDDKVTVLLPIGLKFIPLPDDASMTLGDGGNKHADRNIGCSQQEIAKNRGVGYGVGNGSVGSKKQRIQAHDQHRNYVNGKKRQIFSKDNIGNFYRCGKEQLIRLIFLLLRQDTHCQNWYCDQQNKCGILQRVVDFR